MLQLPPEVYSAIASYVSPRDLLNLCRTSRALQSAAEPKLYETVVVRDVFVAFQAVTMICKNDGERAPYVKRFILYQDPRRMTRIDFTMVPPQFWVSVQEALVLMVNLDYLVLHDPLAAQSWILGHEDIIFQLNELSARLPWDSHLVAFLSRQHTLRVLLLGNECVAEDGPLCPLPAGALSKLEVFGGPTLVAAELLACPLTRLQISVEKETASILPTVVADLGRTMRTLRKLHVLGIPDALMLETLQLVSTSVYAPILRTLGVLPVTPQEVSLFPIVRIYAPRRMC